MMLFWLEFWKIHFTVKMYKAFNIFRNHCEKPWHLLKYDISKYFASLVLGEWILCFEFHSVREIRFYVLLQQFNLKVFYYKVHTLLYMYLIVNWWCYYLLNYTRKNKDFFICHGYNCSGFRLLIGSPVKLLLYIFTYKCCYLFPNNEWYSSVKLASPVLQ